MGWFEASVTPSFSPICDVKQSMAVDIEVQTTVRNTMQYRMETPHDGEGSQGCLMGSQNPIENSIL